MTTGVPQDPYFAPFRVETARSVAWGDSPLNLDSMGPESTIKTRGEPTQYNHRADLERERERTKPLKEHSAKEAWKRFGSCLEEVRKKF